MVTLLQYLEGKKTYLAGCVIFVLLFGTWQGWWKIPDEVYSGLLALGLMFLRSGAKRDLEKATNLIPPGGGANGPAGGAL